MMNVEGCGSADRPAALPHGDASLVMAGRERDTQEVIYADTKRGVYVFLSFVFFAEPRRH